MLIQLLALLFTLVALEGAAGQQIDSPTALVQCAPARLTFSGGVPPYVIDVIPGGEAGAVAMESLEAAASPITWLVDIPAGTNITLRIRDSTGALAFSSPVIVQPGSSDGCLGANASSTSSASPEPTAPLRLVARQFVNGSTPFPTPPNGTTPIISNGTSPVFSGEVTTFVSNLTSTPAPVDSVSSSPSPFATPVIDTSVTGRFVSSFSPFPTGTPASAVAPAPSVISAGTSLGALSFDFVALGAVLSVVAVNA